MNDILSKVEDLRELPAFGQMAPERLNHLASVMVRRTYAAGQVIFLEGEAAGGLWFVTKGRVRIIKQSLNGRTQGLCIINRGKCFGGCPLFDGDINPASAQAVDDVTLLILPRNDLNRAVQNDPQLTSVLLQLFVQRLSHLARVSEGLGIWTTSARINECILAYADHSKPYPIVSLTHEKLAAMAGTSREVVSRHLSQLEKSGAIHVETGQIILLDSDALGHCIATKLPSGG